MKLSIIIPVYNEESNIKRVIEGIKEVLLPSGISKEIIVANDGSTDRTVTILNKYKDDHMIKLHHMAINQGKTAAIREGIKLATGDIILIQDADLEYDPKHYPKLIQPILEGRAQVVYGSRFLGKIEGMRFRYWLANKILTFTANLLYRAKITDEATGYKVFEASLLKAQPLKSSRFNFCPEITARILKRKVPIFEVPINYKGRTTEQGKKIRWQDGISALWTLIKYRFVE